MLLKYSFNFFIILLFIGCGNKEGKENRESSEADLSSLDKKEILIEKPDDVDVPEGMIWVSGVHFSQGAQDGDNLALPREKPAHPVAVDGFFIDVTEVTNTEFKEFTDETGYVTIAERPVDWEEMKKQLPAGTPKPDDSLLQPGSLIFRKDIENVQNLDDYSQWWEWKNGANWRHPEGPKSSIEGLDDYPVVHIAYQDALAYCKWAQRSLPTEAQWEAAAHGKMHGGIYTWGDDESQLTKDANTWQGEFPVKNKAEDGFKYVAPVKSFPPSSLGLYDMAGNVWEWTQDWFDINYYQKVLGKGELKNPKGSASAYNPNNPYQQEKVIKGGSFLCDKSYCASYRISARMGNTMDSATDHTGFRTVATPEMTSE
tara:strand:+ start:742 stop:1854 length:1113 start_codon:yes stop_codon:yes gene_type:complete